MGNRVSARFIRVVHANGKVQDLQTSVLASELVAEDPNFLVCHSISLRVGQRPCPLHPDTELEFGNLYYILPIRTFQSTLAWSHISFLARRATSKKRTRVMAKYMRSGKMSHVLQNGSSTPFHLVLKGDILQITTTVEYLERVREEGLLESVVKVPKLDVGVTPEMRARYVDHLIERSNSWRPNLDTIQEIRAENQTGTEDLSND